MASRGCPYNCSFCFNKRLKELYKDKGKYIRFRSQENVLKEIENVKRNYPLKTIQFLDDVFILKRNWINKFLDEYQKRDYNIPFWCLVRADLLDEELVKKLKLSGCKAVWFGLESGNREIRQKILKKDLTDEHIINAAELLRKYNIKFRVYCMIGIPGETVENAFETIEMNIKMKTPYPWCSILTPYSRTEIGDYAVEKGYLEKDFSINNVPQSFFKYSVIKNENIKELINLHRFFQTCVLVPWTIPLIKRLIKLPPNFLFDLWFGIIYFYVYIKSEGRGFFETILFAIKYTSSVFFKSYNNKN